MDVKEKRRLKRIKKKIKKKEKIKGKRHGEISHTSNLITYSC
jgi:hypothetical protein